MEAGEGMDRGTVKVVLDDATDDVRPLETIVQCSRGAEVDDRSRRVGRQQLRHSHRRIHLADPRHEDRQAAHVQVRSLLLEGHDEERKVG